LQNCGLFSQDYSSIRKKTRLAVFSIIDKTNKKYSDGISLNLDKKLYDKLESELVNSEKFVLVDRNKIESIMQEQSIQQTGLISDQSATSLGKLFGVQLAIFGTINDIYHESRVSLDAGLKIIDIKTREIVVSENKLISVPFSITENSGISREAISKVIIKTAQVFVEKIIEEGNIIPWEARVTNVLPNGKIVINAGIADGVKLVQYLIFMVWVKK
jgi:hypothetical protein